MLITYNGQPLSEGVDYDVAIDGKSVIIKIPIFGRVVTKTSSRQQNFPGTNRHKTAEWKNRQPWPRSGV